MGELRSDARTLESCNGIFEKDMHFLVFEISGIDISGEGRKKQNFFFCKHFLAVSDS